MNARLEIVFLDKNIVNYWTITHKMIYFVHIPPLFGKYEAGIRHIFSILRIYGLYLKFDI